MHMNFISELQITLYEISILNSIKEFYENKINMQIITSIITTKSNISIRLIDYFITKYSKHNKINYYLLTTTPNKSKILFNIYSSYKQQLKIFQKKYFDPFSRGNRIPYFFIDDSCIITTIGQLNFYKWLIEKNIYQYIINNINNIELDMNKHNKLNKTQNKKNVINKCNLIKNNTKNDIHNFPSNIVSFSF